MELIDCLLDLCKTAVEIKFSSVGVNWIVYLCDHVVRDKLYVSVI